MKKTSGDPLVKRLREIGLDAPGLRVTARLYEAILPLSRDADIRLPDRSLDPGFVRRCIDNGEPVLTVEELEVDLPAVETLMVNMLRSVEEISGIGTPWRAWWRREKGAEPWSPAELADLALLRGWAAGIRTALEGGNLDVGDLLMWAAGGNQADFSAVSPLQLHLPLLRIVSHHLLKPLLHAWRQRVVSVLPGMSWPWGYCFVCGAQAVLAELQDNDQAKHLRCGQCGADWQAARLQCMRCGNEDHTARRYLHPAGCDSRHIEACDACKGYLKVINAFTPTLPELVAVEDLATLELDYAAQRYGYVHRGIHDAPAVCP